MTMRAKSGCPVLGHNDVNSGQLNVTRYSFSGCLFLKDSRRDGSYCVGYFTPVLPKSVHPLISSLLRGIKRDFGLVTQKYNFFRDTPNYRI